jgi:glycosyltransferase involved in cell wall biosynthesis
MYNNKKIIVVMPAYNAERTLLATYNEVMEQGIVDHIVLVDDGSKDGTVILAKTLLHVTVHVHEKNRGYGGNQKSCYRLALDAGADIIVMVHPDYQYTPKLLSAMASLIANDLYPCVLGSRILGGYALKGGMPWWKYTANRFLTISQNLLMGAKLSEYHTGYRAYSRQLLESMNLENLSDDFIFDNQFLSQVIAMNQSIGEVSCPTKYFAEASSINFQRSVIYGLGCLKNALSFFFHYRLHFLKKPIWAPPPAT